jgi:hypothetical protein
MHTAWLKNVILQVDFKGIDSCVETNPVKNKKFIAYHQGLWRNQPIIVKHKTLLSQTHHLAADG